MIELGHSEIELGRSESELGHLESELAHTDLACLMRSQVGSEVAPKNGPMTERLGISGSFEPIREENLGSFMRESSTFQKCMEIF